MSPRLGDEELLRRAARAREPGPYFYVEPEYDHVGFLMAAADSVRAAYEEERQSRYRAPLWKYERDVVLMQAEGPL